MAFPETLMAPHSFRLYFTSLCLLALSITSATAQQRPYPPEVVRSYIASCTANRGSEVETICACTIRKIQAKYTFEEFKRINSQIETTGKIPPGLVEILNTCQANPNS
jgi:hypothetical protein